MSSIGKFLRKLRGEMTFREAAERSGLSHSYIRYLEMGKRPGSNTPINPTPETLESLSKAYNYPYKELMIRAGYIKVEDNEPFTNNLPGDIGSSVREKFINDFVTDLNKLPLDMQKQIHDLIKKMGE